MYMNILPTCKKVHHVHSGTCRIQKKVLDPLKLELESIVNHHMGASSTPFSQVILIKFSNFIDFFKLLKYCPYYFLPLFFFYFKVSLL